MYSIVVWFDLFLVIFIYYFLFTSPNIFPVRNDSGIEKCVMYKHHLDRHGL